MPSAIDWTISKGLFHRKPFAAIMIAVAMLSLAGIPPLPGFIGKFLIFKNVIAAGYITYAVLASSAAISASTSTCASFNCSS